MDPKIAQRPIEVHGHKAHSNTPKKDHPITHAPEMHIAICGLVNHPFYVDQGGPMKFGPTWSKPWKATEMF